MKAIPIRDDPVTNGFAITERLSALAEPTRVRLLRLLERQELGVGELARVVQLPQSTVSRHLKVLIDGGWVQRRSVGPANLVRFEPERAEDSGRLWEVVRDEVRDAWTDDAARLDAVLAQRQVEAREFFERHAERWDAWRRELFGDAYVLPTLLSLLPPEWTVADLGCGTGEVVAALAPHVARVIGVDREQAMLDAAARRIGEGCAVSLRRGGLDDLPIDDASVDAALCMLVLHHVEDLQAAGREARRVLRPGGRLVLLDMVRHDRADYLATLGHVHLGFSEGDVAAWASAVGLCPRGYRALPPAPDAQGPPLFVAVVSREE